MGMKKKILQTAGAGALIAMFAGGAQAALVNGNFEAGDATTGDFYCAASWSCFDNAYTNATDGPNFGPVSHDPGGTQSMKIYGPFGAPGGGAGAYQTDDSVVAGQIYELSAWVMSWVGDPLQGNDLGILQLSFYDGLGGTGSQLGPVYETFASLDGSQPITLVTQDGAETTDWTQMLVSGIAPAGTQSAKVQILKIQTGSPANGGSIFFDDVTLTAIPVPAAVWLFGSGLIGLVGVARRCKVQS
jgi:hypothetical protein